MPIIMAVALLIGGCGEVYDDSKLWEEIDKINDRLDDLEERCDMINEDMAALHAIVAALEEQDFVTSVVPEMVGDQMIFTITFRYGEPVTIAIRPEFNSPMPEIGVSKDEADGCYYWTLNGEWLMDSEGNRVKARGEEVATPKLKIENGLWWISYDEGASWEELGVVEGGSGDSIFKGVTIEGNNVHFELADGTVIVVPMAGGDHISFLDPNVKLVCVLNWDTDGDRELSFEEAAAVTDLGNAFSGTSIMMFDELQYFTALTRVADEAFSNCTALRKLTLPEGITAIGKSAFYRCLNLQEIVMPDGITEIGTGAFGSCGVEYLTLPSNLKIIGPDAFMWSSLVELTLPASVESVGERAFYDCPQLTVVDMSKLSIETLPKSIFEDSPVLQTVALPSSLRTIDGRAFAGSGLSELVVPEGTEAINYNAFENCDNLSELTLPSTLVKFAGFKFSYKAVPLTLNINCENGGMNFSCDYNPIAEINFADNITTIGCFAGAGWLEELSLPESVVSIDDEAFLNSSIREVTIPENVTYIGHGAFYTEDLETVYMKPLTPPVLETPQYDANFYYATTIYVPAESYELYSTREDWYYLWDKITVWE